MEKKVSGALLFGLIVISMVVAVKPVDGGGTFSLFNSPTCNLSLGPLLLDQNWDHFWGFLVITLLCLNVTRKISSTFLLICVFSFMTELAQAWSPTRFCQLTDVIPNFLGMGAAFLMLSPMVLIRRASNNSRHYRGN